MQPILFSIKGVNFYSHGLLAGISLIASYLVIYKIAQTNRLATDDLIDKVLIVFIAGLIGARLVYVILYADQFASVWQYLYIWQGGMVSFGGLVAGLGMFIYLFKKNLWQWLDILAISFLLGLFFWRIGCTLAGDHPSLPSNSWFNINAQIPVTLYEALLGLAGFIIFYYIYSKYKIKQGLIFWSILAYYGLLRMILDAWRLDPIVLDHYHWGQITGLMMLVGSILAIIYTIVYSRKKGE